MNHQHSETAAPGVANRGDDKGKQREEPMRTSTPDELSPPVELDSDANLALCFVERRTAKRLHRVRFTKLWKYMSSVCPRRASVPCVRAFVLTRCGHI